MQQQVLVCGANGQLGLEFLTLAPKDGHLHFHFADRQQLDITHYDEVARYLSLHHIHYCINCAAYTAVDRAETDREAARRVNAEAVQALARACARHGVLLIHFSTDYVYHSQQNRPFHEDAPTLPQGVYAQTKLEGDQLALSENPDTLIFRTSWVYSSFGHNFVKTMLRLAQERDTLKVVYDQIGSPTYAHDLAKAVLELLRRDAAGQMALRDLAGVYHYSNEGVCSWYDLAKAALELKGLTCQVLPIESKDYPTAAQRPPYSVLSKEKFKSSFGMDIPYWRDSLAACLHLL